MHRRILWCFTCAFLASGCGTVLNVAGSSEEEGAPLLPYGGTLVECKIIYDNIANFDPKGESIRMYALDLPFTIVGDTLTLPYVLWHNLSQTSQPPQAASSEVKSASCDQ